jgi:hypothetical protein
MHQMMSIFNSRFETLSLGDQSLHLLAIFLTTLSIALIMSPAAYHRIVEPEFGSKFFIRLTSKLIAAAMVPLIPYVRRLYRHHSNVQSVVLSATIAILIFVVFAGLWFAYPLARRRRALSPGLR